MLSREGIFLSQEFDGSSMRLRMLVGDFDPKDKVAYQNYGYEHLNTDEYKVWCICCSWRLGYQPLDHSGVHCLDS